MSEPVQAPIAALVLGLGVSGLGMARWCTAAGMRVTVADTRPNPPQLAQLREGLPSVQFVCAPLEPELLQSSAARLVLKSPGIAPQAIAGLCASAAASGLAVAGELALFCGALEQLRLTQNYQPMVLAITGTNGKTTVTALTGLLVARAGKTVAVAGNIGPTLLDTLAEKIARAALPQVWVIELSSFQLADAVSSMGCGGLLAPLEPTAGCVLNLSQDHLDWHGSMSAYCQAKARVFGSRGHLVLNRDDARVMAMLPAAVRRPVRTSTGFGSGMPQRPGDFGIDESNGMAWLVRALQTDPTDRPRRGQEAAPLVLQRLLPAEALRIHGRHNASNALAALALACAAGCELAPMLYGLREYRGEPHRVESIAIVDDVEYFDDSKGTNVGATVAAITGLGGQRKLVLILGGDGKGQDFGPLAQPVTRHARAVLLIGRDAPLLRQALQHCGVPLACATSMEDAVARARALARAGDAVLLSPACASLDMFDNYVHRARVFCDAVAALGHDSNTVLEARV